MSLYLSPPSGIVQGHKLEEYALKRLHFLLRLVACQNEHDIDDVLQDADVVHQSDCLICGTAKDAISHYILRLLLGGDRETKSFFLEGEAALFRLRIVRMNAVEWADFFRLIDKEVSRFKVQSSCMQNPILLDLALLMYTLKDDFGSWQQLGTELCKTDTTASIHLPFQMVFKLVANRQVNLHEGVADVPLAFLRDVLLELFEKLMGVAVKQAGSEREAAMSDERIQRLFSVLKQAYRKEAKPNMHLPRDFPPLQIADLWSGQVLFPPCMESLLTVLKMQHRLKHHDRFIPLCGEALNYVENLQHRLKYRDWMSEIFLRF